MTRSSATKTAVEVADTIQPSEAFKGQLADTYSRIALGVTRYLIKRGFSEHTAEEALQTAAVKALTKHGQFNPAKGNMDSWFSSIAYRAAVDAVRRPANAPAPSLDAQREVNGFDVEDMDANPEEATIYLETRDEIADAMASLPDKYSRLLELRYMEGNGYEDIAEIQGLTPQLVKARLHHARALIKRNHPELEQL